MTKRTLLIIIAVLAVLDIAAVFWYMASHINSDGKGFGLFGSDDTAATAADIIGDEKSIPDEFELIEQHAYFTSRAPQQPQDPMSYYTCIKRVKAKMPKSVNGNSSISDLLSEINRKAFGVSASTLTAGINAFLREPHFNTALPIDYKTISSAPNIAKKYGNVTGVSIFPTLTSTHLLIVAIEKTCYNGERKLEKMGFVAYDRVNQRVVSNNEVLQQGKHQDIVNLINDPIGHIESRTGKKFQQATEVPAEIYLGQRGISFIFQPGKIADEKDGIKQVFVTYKALRPYLTKPFYKMVLANSRYSKYKSLHF